MSDAISWVRVSSCTLPLANPISDAKVLTGRQKPMTEIAILFVEVKTKDGAEGVGFSYSKRAGGPGQFAHAKEIAPVLIGEDPSDIAKLWDKLCWAGASVGRSGMSTQAIGAFDVALWDLKARRANLPLFRLLGGFDARVPCYAGGIDLASDTNSFGGTVTLQRTGGAVNLHATGSLARSSIEVGQDYASLNVIYRGRWWGGWWLYC